MLALASMGANCTRSQPGARNRAPMQQPAAPGAETRAAAEESQPPTGDSEAEHMRWLADHIQALIDERPALASARVGVLMQDIGSGRVLYERASHEGYNVASNAKIITIAAALALLGPDFRYRTAVLAEAVNERGVITGDLYLQSQGDPSLTTAGLEALAGELVAAGVTGVRGDLIVDDTYFDDHVSPPHFDEQPLEQAAFRAPVGAVSLERNAFTIVVRPARGGVGPADVWLEPASPYLRLARAQVLTQPSGRHRLLVDSKRVDDHMDVLVSGQVRADAGLMRFRRRVDDPQAYAGESFRAILKERGIRVRRPARRGRAPAEARLLGFVDSEPMSVLVRSLGKYSDNFAAEALLKTIAAEHRRAEDGDVAAAETPATWKDGIAAVERFLSEDIGLPAGSFRYGNGSGLFEATEISPAQIVAVLVAAHQDMRYGPDLMASLSIAGVDGTLRRRMADTPAGQRVRAKTGTLATVIALSGYAAADARQPVAFSIIVNDVAATWSARHQARSLQDGIAEALVAYLASPRPPPAP